MKKLTLVLLISLVSSPVFAGQLEEDVDRSLEQNKRVLQKEDVIGGDVIRQQDQLLKTLKEVDLLKSLEEAREALKKAPKKQPKFLTK